MTWPMPVVISTCLKPPPAPTMKMMPAIGGRDFSRVSAMASLFILPPRPRMKIPAMTAISSATAGVPRKSMSALSGASEPAQTMSVSALSSISTTGIRMLTSAATKVGRGGC